MLVGECGVSPDYFLDKMSSDEIALFLKGYQRRNREAWERTRSIAYVIAQVNSTKRIKMDEFMPFEWDKPVKISKNEINKLREQAKKMEAEINGK